MPLACDFTYARSIEPTYRRLLRSTPVTTISRHLITIIITISAGDFINVCWRLHCKANFEALHFLFRPFSNSLGHALVFETVTVVDTQLLPSNAMLLPNRRPWRTAYYLNLFSKDGEGKEKTQGGRARKEAQLRLLLITFCNVYMRRKCHQHHQASIDLQRNRLVLGVILTS